MASKSLGTLTISLVAQISGWTQGLDKAERQSKKFRDSVAKDLSHAKTALIAFGAASVAATAALIKSSIDSADALSKQAQQVGLTTNQLSAYRYAADLSDVSAQELTDSIVKMSRAVDEDHDAFKRLGIDLRDASGNLKDNGALFEEVAEKISQIAPGATKTALVLDLFGKSGAKLIPLLNGGAEGLEQMRIEAERLGLIIDQETATAAEAFNDNLTRLKSVITGTGNELAEALLPKLVEFSNLIQDPATQQAIKDIVTGLANITINAVELATTMANVSRFFGEGLAAMVNGAAVGDLPRLEDQLADITEELERLKNVGTLGAIFNVNEEERIARLEASKKKTEELIQATKDLYKVAPATAPTGAPAANAPTLSPQNQDGLDDSEKLLESAKKRLEQYQQEIALIGQTSEVSKARYELDEGALKGLIDTNKELYDQILLNAEVVDSEKWLAEFNKRNKASEREQAQLQAQIDLEGEKSQAAIYRYNLEHGLIERSGKLNESAIASLYEQLDIQKELAEQDANDEAFADKEAALQRQIDLLGETSEAAVLLYDIEHGGYDQFREDQQDKLLLLAQELEEREKAQKEFEEQEKDRQRIRDELARNTQNILADALRDGTKEGADNALETFKNMLADMATQAVAADIMKFFTGLGKGGESGGGLLATAGKFFAGFFDGGGMIPAGQFGIAGENGAEIIRGPAMVTSTADTAKMLGGRAPITNNYNIVLPNARTREEGDEAGSAFARRNNRMNAASGRYS